MRHDKTQSRSFSVYEERRPGIVRLSESMALDTCETHQPAAPDHHSQDNSTESEDPPAPATPSHVQQQQQQQQQQQSSISNGIPAGGGQQDIHLTGKELLNTVVHLPVEVVYNLLFQQEQFMIDVYTIKKTFDVVFGKWEEQEGGHKTRQVTYTMTLPSANLGPKVSYVTEKQAKMSHSRQGESYVVEVETTNSGIPYADAFTVASRYCITKEDEARTRVSVWVSVKFKKTLWGLVKTMIERNTYSGVEGVLAEVVTHLVTEADKLAAPKVTVRRRRRLEEKNSSAAQDTSTSLTAEDKTGKARERMTVVVMVVVVAAVVVLSVVNLVLYLRLSRLELDPVSSVNTMQATKYLSVTGSWEVVARLLQRQEEMHHHQLQEWKTKLKEATLTLKEVQVTIEDVLKGLPEHEDRLRRLLQQHSEEVAEGWLAAEASLQHELHTLETQQDANPGNADQQDTSPNHSATHYS